MIDLYSKELPIGVLDNLYWQVFHDAPNILDKECYYLPDVCAGGEIIPLAAMNDDYPVVHVLKLVLEDVIRELKY
jgi:hypothetical protein